MEGTITEQERGRERKSAGVVLKSATEVEPQAFRNSLRMWRLVAALNVLKLKQRSETLLRLQHVHGISKSHKCSWTDVSSCKVILHYNASY